MAVKRRREDKTETRDVFTSYADMLHYVAKHGEKAENGTHFVSNVTFGVDVSRLHDIPMGGVIEQFIALPEMRGGKPASMRYAITEAIWYMQATQRPEFIIPFGEIWDRMRDAAGNVNSNYGYQAVDGNRWLQECECDILRVGLPENDGVVEMPMSILRRCNVNSTSDMPCNNFVKLRFTPVHDRWPKCCGWIDVEVTTRSLDLMYGLPYDLFAAEGLGARVAAATRRRCDDGVVRGAALRNVTFTVANAHVYDRDLKDALAGDIENERVVVIPFYATPYAGLTLHNTHFGDKHASSGLAMSDVSETDWWRKFDESLAREYREEAMALCQTMSASLMAWSGAAKPMTEAIGVETLSEKAEEDFRTCLHGLLDDADATRDADELVDMALKADRKAAAIYRSVQQVGASEFDAIVYIVKHSGGLHAYVQDTGLDLYA